MPDTITMDPDAVLDIAFDWSDWVQSGETISSYTIDPSGITVDSDSETNGVVTVWVSSGTVDTYATVACEIVTNQGRTDERTMIIRVRNR